MIALFRQKSPGNVAVLLVFGLLLKLPLFLHPRWTTDPDSDGWLYTNMVKGLPPGNAALLAGCIAFVLLYVQALLMNHLVNEYRMTGRQTFLPGMAFMLLTSLVPEWSYLSAPLLAGTLIVWAFHKLFELYNAQTVNTRIYNIGLLIGIASFFYFPSIFFAACMLLGFGILRPFRLNEVLLLLLGITTPYYFWAAYLFLTDRFTWMTFVPQLGIGTPRQQPSYWMLASIILIGIPFLMGGFYIQTQLRKMLIQARKNWSIILLFVLLAVFIPFINNHSSYTPWVLTAAPVAAFHACAFLYPGRKWVPGLLFFLMIVFIFLQQYGPLFWKK